MPNTTLRHDLIENLRENRNKNYEEAKELVEMVQEINELNSLNDSTKNIQVDATRLEDILNKAITEDPDNKHLEDLENSRYMLPRDNYKRRSIVDDIAFEEDFFKKSEVDFRRNVRMSKKCFLALYEEIKDDEVYFPRAGPAQRSVKFQMIVALTRFGLYGNGASNKSLGDSFHISRKQLICILVVV